jgi:hypothetical protein
MKTTLAILLFLLIFNTISYGEGPIKTDRWLEIDLYWFDKGNMEKSVDLFWKRFLPLVDEIGGWKGVILNVGWISDYILEWQGDLNQEIKLPKNMKQSPVFKVEGQLSGTTLEREELWKNRFENADKFQVISYERWTYADLKKLVNAIKKVAQKKYNLLNIKVGTLVLGWESIYSGDVSEFSNKHPNVYLNNAPNLEATLTSDLKKYGAFPEGIPGNTPFTEFFGKQWGDLSKDINLDVLILRDSFLGVGVYSRRGPFGQMASDHPEKVSNWSKATADLVKQTKISNPEALVIGYSSAASAVADWRVNCFDLEAIAREGFLDAWIDQTWAGAWNELGQRPETFWNNPLLGWTYQLSYMLLHGAVLSDTKVHHYFLTETFDAWESWDIIHNAKDRLRWGMWAYSHAAVVTPGGLKMPSGNYISWCNQGKRLLSEADVEFLTENLNSAIIDAGETKKIFGPTLVYCRSSMEWQSKNKPDESIKEWIDEQAGTLMKWSVPILSVTRLEYLPSVVSDMFIFQTPVHMKKSEKENIIKVLESGKPSAIFASLAGGLDKDISEMIGVNTKDTIINTTKFIGTLNYNTGGIFSLLPNTFPVFQPYTKNNFTQGMKIIYSVANSPTLGFNQMNRKQILFWDAPEFSKNLPSDFGDYGESLDQILGSPTPYVITARLFNEIMKNNGLIYIDEIMQDQPVNLSAWQLQDGSYKIMAGNLEEGINHSADHSTHTVLNLPPQLTEERLSGIQEKWNGTKIITGNHKLNIDLEQGQTKLFILNGEK